MWSCTFASVRWPALAALLVWLSLTACLDAARAAELETRPNIIVLLADDLGWTDLGSFGSDFYESPHLDRLARRGMRFTNAYAASCVCSPTRAALLTGRTPARVGITDFLAPNDAQVKRRTARERNYMLLPPEQRTRLPLAARTTRGVAGRGRRGLSRAELGLRPLGRPARSACRSAPVTPDRGDA